MHQQMKPEMRACIEECLRCHSMCLGMASHHCLEQGGRHVEPAHFRLMLACAEICRSAADMMLIGSESHKRVCAVCADVCDACARSCEQIGDMQDCVEHCRRCAESCRRMAA
jgi:hypothetical protein